MTDCLMSSGGLGGGPSIVASSSSSGGGSNNSSSSTNSSGSCGDREQHPRLPPSLGMFAKAAPAVAMAASNGPATTGSVGSVASPLPATGVTTSSSMGGADLVAPAITTGHSSSSSSSISLASGLRQHSPPTSSSAASTASDASGSGTGGGLVDSGVAGGDGYNNIVAVAGAIAAAAAAAAASNNGSANTGGTTCLVGSGRIREKHLMQLISSDALEPFGYGSSNEQRRQNQQQQQQPQHCHLLPGPDGDKSHCDMANLLATSAGCVDDGRGATAGSFSSSSSIELQEHNDFDHAGQDDADVLSAMNSSESQKDLMVMVYKKLQQEQQERQRVKRLQMPRKPHNAKPAQSIEGRLQQGASHQQFRQHLQRHDEDGHPHQQTRDEAENEQNAASSDSTAATTVTAAATLGDLLENLSNCADVGGVDFDEKLLMRLMRNLTTQAKHTNEAGAPIATSLIGGRNDTIGSGGDGGGSSRCDEHKSPRLVHDRLGNIHGGDDHVLGNLQLTTNSDLGELSDGGSNGSNAGVAAAKEIAALRTSGSTSTATTTSYQGPFAAAPPPSMRGLMYEHRDEAEHDALIRSHHGEADNDNDENDDDDEEEDNDDLLGGSLEDDDGDAGGSGDSGSGGGDGVCGVCREPYAQPPRVLNCLHVFCEACLAKLRSKKKQQPTAMPNFSRMPSKPPGGGFIVCCPKCQVETECVHGVQTLPLDYVLINRLDTEAIHKRTAVCTSCKSEDNAIARCQDCSNFLCSNCRKAHSSMLCFENHKVVSFEAFDEERAHIHRAVCCLRHPREVAVLYDPVCGVTMCNDCLVAGHQGHGCKKAFHFDSRERTDLTGLLGEARHKFNAFDDANDALTTSLSELQLTRDSVRSSIEETFITYKNLLERAKAAALDDLEKVHSAQEMRVMDDIQQCQESRVHLEHALSFADKLVKYGDAGEFLALKTLVTSRVRKLMCDCPQSRDQGELRFVTDEVKFAQAVNSLFGHIVPTNGSQRQQQQNNSLLQSVRPSSDNAIGGLNSSHNSVSSVGSGTAGSLLNASFGPEISNSSAARLLPSDIVDVVSASASSGMVPPGPHFGSLEHSPNGIGHPILPPPGGPLSAGRPPTLPQLDPIVAPAEINELSSALAQFGLATLAGVDQVDVPPNPDVLPLLLRDVAPGPRGMGVGSENVRIGPPTGPPPGVTGGPTDEENHLMNNLSALAKMGSMGPAPYAGSPVPMNGHGGPLRGGSGPVAPLALTSGALAGGLDASGAATGQRSPTSSVTSVALSSSTPGAPPSVSSAGNSSAAGSNAGRGTRMTPMHIRIKFGQLGSGPTQFSSPHGFCLGPNEEIVVADTNNHRVQIFDKAGELKNEFGTQGKEEGQLWYPRKVAVLKSTGTYVICDRGNERSRMQLFTKNGEFLKKIAIRYIDIVAGLALTSDGRIVAVDSVSPTVFVIADTGDLLLWFDCSEHMREPSDIAVWGTEFYICDFKGHCIVVYNECGSFLRRIGGEGLTNFPNGIDISDHGDILVGDSHGNRFHIVVFNREGHAISEFECPYCKVSRCCGLKITSEGYVVTLAKNNHHVLILNTLYIT